MRKRFIVGNIESSRLCSFVYMLQIHQFYILFTKIPNTNALAKYGILHVDVQTWLQLAELMYTFKMKYKQFLFHWGNNLQRTSGEYMCKTCVVWRLALDNSKKLSNMLDFIRIHYQKNILHNYNHPIICSLLIEKVIYEKYMIWLSNCIGYSKVYNLHFQRILRTIKYGE